MTLRGGPVRSSEAASTVPGWRVEDFHRLLTHFFQEGVVQGVGGDLAVTERSAGANMSVDVAAGLALIEITTTLLDPNDTLKTWLHSDAVENVLVPAADATNARIDRVVAKFDVSVDPNGVASNIVSIELVEGTPDASPAAPAVASNAIPLYQIAVAAGASSITDANLTDERTFVKLLTDVLQDIARVDDLASTANGKGASLIGVEDTGSNYTGDTVEEVLAEIAGNLGGPTGMMAIWATDTAPSGWLLCYGQAVSRTTYAALFAVISTTFGVGDGSTTFNLPDMRGRFPLGQDDMGGAAADRVTNVQADTLGGTEGAEDHTIASANLPTNLGVRVSTNGTGADSADSVLTSDSGGTVLNVVSVTSDEIARLQLTSGDTTSDIANTAVGHMNPYITVNYIIKT